MIIKDETIYINNRKKLLILNLDTEYISGINCNLIKDILK